MIGAITAGLFSDAGAPASTNSFESIQTFTLGSSQSSISFTSIPSTYKNLQIRALARTDRAANPQDFLQIRYNSDTGAYYAYHSLYGNGASAGASDTGTSTANPWSAIVAGATATTSVFGGFVADLLDYTNTNKYKTLRSFSGIENNDSNGRIYFQSNLWINTAAVTTITIAPVHGTNFVTNSSFALYGIK